MGSIYTWGSGSRSVKLPENNEHITSVAADEWGAAIALTDDGVAQPIKNSFMEFEDTSLRLEDIAQVTSRSALSKYGEAFTYSPLSKNGKPTGIWKKKSFAHEVKSIASTSETIGDCVINIGNEVECHGEGEIVSAFSDISLSINSPKEIACGQLHCIVLQMDGSVLAWGDRFDIYAGVLDVPPELTMVTSISADVTTNYAVVNGRLAAWGSIYIPLGLHELFVPGGVTRNFH